ncbi:hypothetical protein [Pseudomonas sp. NPDC007930]|uniref:hypothetical protein n=1 Tax=Pseudomonas sp. NPDC007930 TaxID=3364417 RepID=UPI0036E93EDA
MINQPPVTTPLALIAIFTGMIEASALASLPLLDDESKRVYVWFLIGFPPFLVTLFFVTLNFNHRALYEPPAPQAGAPAQAPPGLNEAALSEALRQHGGVPGQSPVIVVMQPPDAPPANEQP